MKRAAGCIFAGTLLLAGCGSSTQDLSDFTGQSEDCDAEDFRNKEDDCGFTKADRDKLKKQKSGSLFKSSTKKITKKNY